MALGKAVRGAHLLSCRVAIGAASLSVSARRPDVVAAILFLVGYGLCHCADVVSFPAFGGQRLRANRAALMDVLRLELPEPPSLNSMWRKWRNRMVLSAEGRAFKQAVAMKAAHVIYGEMTPAAFKVLRAAPTGPLAVFPSGDVAVTIRWYRSAKRGDLDNRAKCCLDALQGVIYRDDKQVSELHLYRIDTPEDHGTGRVVVEIQTLNGKRFA
jgi:Holliday junction resolvase RusA-like endonuclease